MTGRYSREATTNPTPLDLVAFLPYACARLQAPFALRVVPYQQDEYVSRIGEDKTKKGKQGKSTTQATSRTLESATKAESASFAAVADYGSEVVTLGAGLDAAGRLVELRLRRAPPPRLLLRALALLLPFHPRLARLALRWSPPRGAALRDLALLLPASNITELCLDDSPASPPHYALLLDEPSSLRSLSLARCDVGDAECAELAARLHHPLPAARSLALLALPGNRIGDAGAAALAAALRSNRSLQYLNLAGNGVTDEGAEAVLRSLMEFPLTSDELIAQRGRRLDYLRAREEMYHKCYAELTLAMVERAADDASRSGRRRTAQAAAARGRKSLPALVGAGVTSADALATRAYFMATELLGAYADPFGSDETVTRDGRVYCTGNTTLCALNLAYNELGFASVVRLLEALRRQEALARKAGAGLVRAVLDGNALPACRELREVQALLDAALSGKLAKPQKKSDKTSARPKSKSQSHAFS